MALSTSTIEVVKATVPVLKEHGVAIIGTFYDILFEKYPSVKPLFNVDNQKGGSNVSGGAPRQVSALARSVLAYAIHIDKLDAIRPVVERICHVHVSRGVEAPHYDAVGECLLEAMQKVLGEGATPEVLAAWGEAYAFLAKLFVDSEAQLRQQLANKAGFDGATDMRVVSSAPNPTGKGTVVEVQPTKFAAPSYASGQFVSIAVDTPQGEKTTTTCSLVQSSAPDKMAFLVPESEERAFAVLRSMEPNSIIMVSMPCGKEK